MREKMIVAGLLVAVSFSGVPGSAEASLGSMESEIEDIEERLVEIKGERDQIGQELTELERELGFLLVDREDTEGEIDRLDSGISANERRMVSLEEEISKGSREVRNMERDIDRMERSIERRLVDVGERAVSYQKDRGFARVVDVVLGSGSMGDMVSGLFAMTKIDEADNRMLESLENDQEDLRGMKVNLESRLEVLGDNKQEVEGIKMYMEEQKGREVELRERLVDQEYEINSKMGKLREVRGDLYEEDREFSRRVDEIEEEIREEKLRIAEQERIEEEKRLRVAEEERRKAERERSNSEVVGSSVSGDVTMVGRKFIGNSTYVFGGGRNPADIRAGRFDCSSFVAWSFRQVGISLPTTTDGQIHAGIRVSSSERRPGDLVFFDTYKRNGHVGIYLGDNKFLGAQSSTGVAVADMSTGYWAQQYNGNVVRVN